MVAKKKTTAKKRKIKRTGPTTTDSVSAPESSTPTTPPETTTVAPPPVPITPTITITDTKPTPPVPVNETPAPKVLPLTETHHQSMGPAMLILFLILAGILGGLYLWGSAIQKERAASETSERIIPNNEPETVRSMTDAEILSTVSSSDELSAIEADLGATNLESLGQELVEMENELNAYTPQ